MSTASATISIQYPAPGGGTAQPPAITKTITMAGATVGTIDIPTGTAAATAFSVPFGSVAVARGLVIINNTSFDIGLRPRAAVADTYILAPGGVFVHAEPTDTLSGGDELDAFDVTTTDLTVADETVDFFVFGT